MCKMQLADGFSLLCQCWLEEFEFIVNILKSGDFTNVSGFLLTYFE